MKRIGEVLSKISDKKIFNLSIFILLTISALLIWYNSSALQVYVLKAGSISNLTIAEKILKERFQVLYGYSPDIKANLTNLELYVKTGKDISAILHAGDLKVVQNAQVILNNSDLVAVNYLGPIRLNQTVEFEFFLFVKNSSVGKFNTQYPAYVFVDRPEKTVVLLNSSMLDNRIRDQQILELQKALVFSEPLPVFVYSNQSDLDSILQQLNTSHFVNYTAVGSNLPPEFVQKLKQIGVNYVQKPASEIQPKFAGANLYMWKAVGLLGVVYPSLNIQNYLKSNVLPIFSVSTNRSSTFIIDYYKNTNAILSTLPLPKLQLVAVQKYSPDYSMLMPALALLVVAMFVRYLTAPKKVAVLYEFWLSALAFAVFGANQATIASIVLFALLPRKSIRLAFLLGFALLLSIALTPVLQILLPLFVLVSIESLLQKLW